jgi:hypothetical protein
VVRSECRRLSAHFWNDLAEEMQKSSFVKKAQMKKKLGSVERVVQKSGPVQIAQKYKKTDGSLFAVKPEERLKCWIY